jgi:hypothetical protein
MDRAYKASSPEEPEPDPLNTDTNNFQIPIMEFTEPEEREHPNDGTDPARPEPASSRITGVRSPQRGAKDTRLAPIRHDATQSPNLTRFVFGKHAGQQPDADVVAEADGAEAPAIYGRHSQGWIWGSGVMERSRS